MGQEEVDSNSVQPEGVSADSGDNLGDLRNAIDAIDTEILKLINQRLKLAQMIGSLKKKSGSQVVDSKRELEIMNRLTSLNKGPLSSSVLRHIFSDIIAAGRAIQQTQQVAFLGPEATFSHIAGMAHFGYSVVYSPQPTIRELFSEVEKGSCSYGVVPVDNSVEDSVRHTFDFFFESDLKICAELFHPVSFDLMANSSDLKGIEVVYAHPIAFSQCRNWLRQHLPEAVLRECGGSARAIQKAFESRNAAAIAGRNAAAMFGLEVVASKIEDYFRNAARFLVIGKENVRSTGKDKTSLMFALSHHPGALSQVLAPFAAEEVNLVKIESRPVKHEHWSHFFFLDVEGHMEESPLKEIVAQIKPICLYFKWLGSYPQASVQM